VNALDAQHQGYQILKKSHFGGFPGRNKGESQAGSCLMVESLLTDLIEKRRST
jgi:hypothetical protein